MLLFLFIAFIYGSNSISLEKLTPTPLVTGNATKKSSSLAVMIKSNPKKFLSEAQKLDPEALQNVIALLKDLLEQSEATESDLVEALDDKKNALNDANTDWANAEDALTAANQAVTDAQGVLSTKEQEAASAQTDVDNKRETHEAKQAEKDTWQGKHDDELPGLNDEQQVLRDVISLLEGLPDAAQWKEVAQVSGSTVADKAFWNGKCGPFGDLTTESIVLVHMGEIKDYYKPTSDMSLCHFLTSHEYSWSSTEEGNYAVPNAHYDTNHLGGSSGFTAQMEEDGRSYVSFWGYNSAAYGGCCHYKDKVYGGTLDGASWHREFTLYVKQFA